MMTTSSAVINRLSTRAAAIAVTVMFVVNGAVIGGFGGALPSLRDKLGLIASSADIEALATRVADNGDVYIVPAFSGNDCTGARSLVYCS